MTAIEMSTQDKEFLAQCEKELQHRFTEKDEEFMKILNSEPPQPPIVDSWWVPRNSGQRNERRFNRRNHPYERYGNRDRSYQDRRDNHDRGPTDYSRGYGQRNQRPRYH